MRLYLWCWCWLPVLWSIGAVSPQGTWMKSSTFFLASNREFWLKSSPLDVSSVLFSWCHGYTYSLFCFLLLCLCSAESYFCWTLFLFLFFRDPCPVGHPAAQPVTVPPWGLSIMRGRCSRKLGVAAKAGFLIWLLWLGYLLLERSSFPSAASSGEDDEEHDLQARQLSLEESGANGQLARPLYMKPPADSNLPGEWGRATHLTLSPEEKKQEQDTVERYAINIFVSDKISLHRHIQDNRMIEWVKQKVIPKNRKWPL